MLKKPLLLAMLMAASATQVAFADLHDRGGGMIYDDVLNVTWLQDVNYAMTSGYDADGMMNWYQATDWAEQLIYGGHSDWRLPKLTPVNGSSFTYDFSDLHSGNSDVSWNNSGTNSELGYMYHVNLGNAGSCDTSGLPAGCETLEDQPGYIANFTYNPGPFKNFSRGPDGYTTFWTNTLSPWERDPIESPEAWVFHFTGGGQDPDWVLNADNFAWAVRDGDVAAVPEPETYALMLAGLGLVGFAARRRRHESLLDHSIWE